MAMVPRSVEERSKGWAAVSDRPIRVLQFIEGGGRYGAAVSVLNLTTALAARGIDVEVAVFKGKPLGQAFRERGIIVHEIDARKRYDVRGISQVKTLLKNGRYDVLHTHLSKATIIGTVAGRLARVPVVATVHGMNKKYTYMGANRVVTVSEAARQHLTKQGLPGERIAAIYNGISADLFEDRPSQTLAREALGIDPHAYVIGTISRAERTKGIFECLAAVKLILDLGEDIHYLFVGDGSHLTELQEEAVKLGIANQVQFAGFQEQIAPYLAAMDAYVFPTKQEAFGISLLEAMACRLPIITTQVGGIPEILDNSNARFIEPEDVDGLAKAIIGLKCNPSEAAKLGDAAYLRFREKFTIEASAQQAAALYGDLIASFLPSRSRVSL